MVVADFEDRRSPPFRAVLEAVLDPSLSLKPPVHLAIASAIGHTLGFKILGKIIVGGCHAGCQLLCVHSYAISEFKAEIR
jgi:hypothetical protein